MSHKDRRQGYLFFAMLLGCTLIAMLVMWLDSRAAISPDAPTVVRQNQMVRPASQIDSAFFIVDTNCSPTCTTFYTAYQIITNFDSLLLQGLISITNLHVETEFILGVLTFPLTDGSDGQVLKTDALG